VVFVTNLTSIIPDNFGERSPATLCLLRLLQAAQDRLQVCSRCCGPTHDTVLSYVLAFHIDIYPTGPSVIPPSKNKIRNASYDHQMQAKRLV
jgi:hypothetical protein